MSLTSFAKCYLGRIPENYAKRHLVVEISLQFSHVLVSASGRRMIPVSATPGSRSKVKRTT